MRKIGRTGTRTLRDLCTTVIGRTGMVSALNYLFMGKARGWIGIRTYSFWTNM